MSNPIKFIMRPDEKASQIIKEVFADFKYEILDSTLHDFQGSETYVLTEKCKDALSNGMTCPVVTDITSVCFNALGGLPGTLITSFVEKLSSVELYKLLDAWDDKSAYVMYSLGLLEDKDSKVQVFQGCLPGTIVKPKKANAKGWQACFQPDGYTKAYSDLPKNTQVAICERKKALRSLKTYLISKEFFCC